MPHNCKTTFVGGINPWAPPPPKKREVKIHGDVIRAMSDGKRHSISSIMELIEHDSYGYVAGTLARMAQSGMIRRESVARQGGSAVPMYSLWSTE